MDVFAPIGCAVPLSTATVYSLSCELPVVAVVISMLPVVLIVGQLTEKLISTVLPAFTVADRGLLPETVQLEVSPPSVT
jgi:hypothetical protein